MDRFLRLCFASPVAVQLLQNDFEPALQGS